MPPSGHEGSIEILRLPSASRLGAGSSCRCANKLVRLLWKQPMLIRLDGAKYYSPDRSNDHTASGTRSGLPTATGMFAPVPKDKAVDDRESEVTGKRVYVHEN